jgi:transcriptional regulator GlxA family with amidase domain
MLSMIGHPSGAEPLMVDVRQSGSGSLDMRLNAARHLLKSPLTLAVNVIAHRCGFADQSRFSRCFRRAHGMPPGQYRLLADLND